MSVNESHHVLMAASVATSCTPCGSVKIVRLSIVCAGSSKSSIKLNQKTSGIWSVVGGHSLDDVVKASSR